jgi:hypothetical protein
MLQITEHPTEIKTVTVVGRKLARRLKGISSDFRALLAHQAATGEAVLRELTVKQASILFKVSVPYVAAVSRASPEERDLIKRKRLSVNDLYSRRRELTDDQIDRLVARCDPNRLMAALDRYTAPKLPF